MAAELISVSQYNIGPRQGGTPGQMEYVDANIVHGVSPENLVSVENLSSTLRDTWKTPNIYAKVIESQGGLLKEYYTSETVAQIVAKAQV